MSERSTRDPLVKRRGELLAELLLQELGADFVARPAADLGYDYFVGFKNPEGGLNVAAVEVHATDRPVHAVFEVQQERFRRLANSNIPVMLLVVDVKANRAFYAVPSLDPSSADPGADAVAIQLTAVDDRTKCELRDQLANAPLAALN